MKLTIGERSILRYVWDVAHMDTAMFHRENEWFAGKEAEQFTQDVREATRLWRDSYILSPLECLLRRAGEPLPPSVPKECSYCGKPH